MRGINSGNVSSARMTTVTAVTFIVAFAPVLCGLAQMETGPIDADCSLEKKGKVEVKVSKPGTTVELKCNEDDASHVEPPFDKTEFKVCTDKECTEAELLSEYIKDATGTGETVTATVQIKTLPPEAKAFYVRCGEETPDPCYIVVYVDPRKPETGPIVADCSPESQGKVEVKVSKPDTTVELKCEGEDASHVEPPFDKTNFKVCIDESCTEAKLLSEYIKDATGTGESVAATVHIKTLPPEAKAFYVRCGETEPDPCYIVVYVAPSKPGGVTPESPVSCANPGGSITLKIPEKGSTAHFTCGGLTLYPLAADRVFAEDCKKEESLKDIVRSGKGPVYTLTADKKPPKKKWCYLCASSSVASGKPGTASDYCLVHVESSSRSQSSSAVALAAMLPCVLAMLRTT